MNHFYGHEVVSIENSFLQVCALKNGGPRIVGLFYQGSENILAETPTLGWEGPAGFYHIYGGHRIWIAPEDPEICSLPDDSGLIWAKTQHRLLLTGAVEPVTGLQKLLQIDLDPESPTLHLTHTLVNQGQKAYDLSIWAITMFAPGGTALLPQRAEPRLNSRAPDRIFVLWPYSNIQDARLTLADDQILLTTRPAESPFKIGQRNPCGWVEYRWQHLRIQKHFSPPGSLPYPDLGCNVEAYVDQDYLELETLSPLVHLCPGESCLHHETWQIFDNS